MYIFWILFTLFQKPQNQIQLEKILFSPSLNLLENFVQRAVPKTFLIHRILEPLKDICENEGISVEEFLESFSQEEEKQNPLLNNIINYIKELYTEWEYDDFSKNPLLREMQGAAYFFKNIGKYERTFGALTLSLGLLPLLIPVEFLFNQTLPKIKNNPKHIKNILLEDTKFVLNHTRQTLQTIRKNPKHIKNILLEYTPWHLWPALFALTVKKSHRKISEFAYSYLVHRTLRLIILDHLLSSFFKKIFPAMPLLQPPPTAKISSAFGAILLQIFDNSYQDYFKTIPKKTNHSSNLKGFLLLSGVNDQTGHSAPLETEVD